MHTHAYIYLAELENSFWQCNHPLFKDSVKNTFLESDIKQLWTDMLRLVVCSFSSSLYNKLTTALKHLIIYMGKLILELKPLYPLAGHTSLGCCEPFSPSPPQSSSINTFEFLFGVGHTWLDSQDWEPLYREKYSECASRSR